MQLKWMVLIDPGKILLLLHVFPCIPLKIIEQTLIKETKIFQHYHYKKQFLKITVITHMYLLTFSVLFRILLIISQHHTNFSFYVQVFVFSYLDGRRMKTKTNTPIHNTVNINITKMF